MAPLYNKSLSVKGSLIFPLMNSAYNFNLYIKVTYSGSLELPLYTGLTVFTVTKLIRKNYIVMAIYHGLHFIPIFFLVFSNIGDIRKKCFTIRYGRERVSFNGQLKIISVVSNSII